MPLGSTFWAALGNGVRWMHDWTSYYEFSATSPADPYVLTFLHNVKMFQLPFSMSGTAGTKQAAPQHDSGFFYWGTTAFIDGIDTYASCHAAIAQGGNTGARTRPAWKEIKYTSSASMLNGDVPPNVPIVYDSTDYFSGIVQTGFIEKVLRPTGGEAKRDAIFWIMKPATGAGLRRLYHYNPWAWWGTVPAVIADIAMKCGISPTYIDQAAFDNAHDAYDLTTGDDPWTTAGGLATKWEIGCSRRIGTKAIDLLMECARHSRDLYFMNEAGKLSVSSFTRTNGTGNYKVGLTIDEGVVGDVDWECSPRYLYSNAVVTWGSGVVVSGQGDTIDPNSNVYNASEDETLNAYIGNKLAVTAEPAVPPIFGQGIVCLRGREYIRNSGGQTRIVTAAHFPFLLSKHTTAADFAPISHWINSDSKPRRFVTITQDFRALDWGIGSHLTNVAVTDDGQVIPEMWCIERTYDFDRLTVTSVLMERPPNT